MDDSWDDPTRPPQAYEDLGPTRHLTSNVLPLRRSQPKSVPPRIKLLIADLGLRYRPPGGSTDLEAHASALALLTLDVADLPHDRLERAINTWVRSEKWMPKASELVALCQSQQRAEFEPRAATAAKHDQATAFIDSRNAMMTSEPTARKDIEWFADANGERKLRFKRVVAPPLGLINPRDVDRLNRALRKFGAPFRYNRAAYDFDLAVGASDPTDPTNEVKHP